MERGVWGCDKEMTEVARLLHSAAGGREAEPIAMEVLALFHFTGALGHTAHSGESNSYNF